MQGSESQVVRAGQANLPGNKQKIQMTHNPSGRTLNTDRPGGDFFNRSVRDLTSCQNLCQNDKKCKAYVFVPKEPLPNNYQGPPPPHCWLKDREPAPVLWRGVISGTRTD